MAVAGVVGPTEKRLALADQVAELRAQGLLQREVSARLGISRAYASDLERDPEGLLSRARKDSYRGTCAGCGGPTTGSEGPNKRPERCEPCNRALRTAEKKWTREACVDAIQRFARIHGRPPLADEWIKNDEAHGYPPRTSVYQSSKNRGAPFAKWGDAIEAAGFPRRIVGKYARPTPTGNGRSATVKGEKVSMRPYIVLEQTKDGAWQAHEGVESHSEQLAIEAYIEGLGEANGQANGRFVAIPASRWRVRTLQPVTTYKAVPAE